MKGSLSLKLGSLAALYLFWLVCWLVLGDKAFGPVYYNWDESLISAVTAIMAYVVAVKITKPYAIFLQVLGHRYNKP